MAVAYLVSEYAVRLTAWLIVWLTKPYSEASVCCATYCDCGLSYQIMISPLVSTSLNAIGHLCPCYSIEYRIFKIWRLWTKKINISKIMIVPEIFMFILFSLTIEIFPSIHLFFFITGYKFNLQLIILFVYVIVNIFLTQWTSTKYRF